jgi:hypothetical protein
MALVGRGVGRDPGTQRRLLAGRVAQPLQGLVLDRSRLAQAGLHRQDRRQGGHRVVRPAGVEQRLGPGDPHGVAAEAALDRARRGGRGGGVILLLAQQTDEQQERRLARPLGRDGGFGQADRGRQVAGLRRHLGGDLQPHGVARPDGPVAEPGRRLGHAVLAGEGDAEMPPGVGHGRVQADEVAEGGDRGVEIARLQRACTVGRQLLGPALGGHYGIEGGVLGCGRGRIGRVVAVGECHRGPLACRHAPTQAGKTKGPEDRSPGPAGRSRRTPRQTMTKSPELLPAGPSLNWASWLTAVMLLKVAISTAFEVDTIEVSNQISPRFVLLLKKM